MAIDPLSIGIGLAAGAAASGLIVSSIMKGSHAKHEAEAKLEGERNKQRLMDEARADVAKLRADESEGALKRRKEFEKEIKTAQDESREAEKRLEKREDMLDRKLSTLERKEQDLQRLEQKRQEQMTSIEARKKELDVMYEDEKRRLQTIAQLTPDQAKNMLLERVKADIEVEVVEMTNRALNRAKENADVDARKIILNTIQRLASDYVAENTVSTIDLPSDDMKGRIIGREGRNIRAFEKATGVDVIVDDTPGVVVLSCFEPVRREVARLTMEKLIADGRIHPTR
ncbi:MAG: DUF3552 domain-containing protein, partial [Planctomycetes bacterium]|nr:DUF3552 domain-containing protein [Planctomycetota bacterium]